MHDMTSVFILKFGENWLSQPVHAHVERLWLTQIDLQSPITECPKCKNVRNLDALEFSFWTAGMQPYC